MRKLLTINKALLLVEARTFFKEFIYFSVKIKLFDPSIKLSKIYE